jgi:hypothetical protein
MLTVPGPLPISPVQRTDENNLFLRVNQRVAGEILQVANDQVVLAIQGVQIVARLSTPDQLMELQDRRFAQFVVKEINPNVVTLQIVEPDANSKNQILPVINQQDSQLLDGLLNQIGVKPDVSSRLLAQQMIRMGLPVTADNILELQTALQAVPAWGENEAGQAVHLKIMGVPVSADSIQLLSKAPAEVTQTLGNLIGQLEQLSSQADLPAPLLDQIRSAIRIFSQGIIDGDQPAANLIQKLKISVSLFGKTIENELLHSTLAPGSELDHGLMALAKLRTELAARGFTSVAGDIDRLNDYLRLVHLSNTDSSDPRVQNQWFRLELPVHFQANPNTPLREDLHPARLRISREKDGDGKSKVDPNYSRIVIQMDLSPMDSIEVDLSIVSKQIGLAITTTNNHIRDAAADELDSLKEGLNQIGYITRFSQIETEPIQQSNEATQIPDVALLSGSINVEV